MQSWVVHNQSHVCVQPEPCVCAELGGALVHLLLGGALTRLAQCCLWLRFLIQCLHLGLCLKTRPLHVAVPLMPMSAVCASGETVFEQGFSGKMQAHANPASPNVFFINLTQLRDSKYEG